MTGARNGVRQPLRTLIRGGRVKAMTLIVAVNGRHTIWMAADRRLSFRSRVPKDDATKMVFLDTPDGVAILGYAGLGLTGSGTEPSKWVGRVLRGQNLSLEQSLAVIARAMREQLPKHMRHMSPAHMATHSFVVTAFRDEHPAVYSIDLALARDRKTLRFRYTRWQQSAAVQPLLPPPMVFCGSGGSIVFKYRTWQREVLRLAKAHDAGKVSARTVADRLAALNFQVHRRDSYVGPNCIVAWRYRRNGVHKGGGGHQYYSGKSRVRDAGPIPTIARGLDVNAVINAVLPSFLKKIEGWPEIQSDQELDVDAINAELSRLPTDPDENLR